jgi:hypothetical protein
MRSDTQLEGWMFVNFVCPALLLWGYTVSRWRRIFCRSSHPGDVVIHLSRIQRLRIGKCWRLAEIPQDIQAKWKLGVSLKPIT